MSRRGAQLRLPEARPSNAWPANASRWHGHGAGMPGVGIRA